MIWSPALIANNNNIYLTLLVIDMTFRIALGLIVRPDFSDAEAGRSLPPRINHSRVDFNELLNILKEWFPYGPAVNISTPNDMIDIITTQARVNSGVEDAIRCLDFGEILIKCAKSQKTTIIDVKKAWSSLHYLKDRDSAPPPSMITFVVEAVDFEDAMLWMSSTLPSLGLPTFNIMSAIEDKNEIQQSGRIPSKIKQRLEDVIGCKFEDSVMLTRFGNDKLPRYVAEASAYFQHQD